MSAALIGSGVGLSLGAAYLAGGMAQHAADHNRVERIAMAAAGGYSSAMLQDQGVLRLTDQPSGAVQARQLAQLTERLENNRTDGKVAAKSDLECLTQAVYYEARGESRQGQFAVAQVVMNRVKHPAFPKTVCGVVFQGSARRSGCQFSFACDGSMRAGRESGAWQRARQVASRVLAGAAVADVGSATHFHTTAVSPSWGPQMRRVAQVGMHVFYNFNSGKAIQTAKAPLQAAVLTSGLPEKPIEYRLTKALVVDKVADGPQAASAEDGAAPAVEKTRPASVQPAHVQPAHGKGADSAGLKAQPASDAASS